jgi:hypothetical protein
MTRSFTGHAVRPTLVLLLAAALASGCTPGGPTAAGSPTPTPARTTAIAGTTPLPLSRTFVSPRDHYAMAYPDGWTVTPASRAWSGSLEASDPGVSDVFRSSGHAAVAVASQRLPLGWTEARWFSEFLPPAAQTAVPRCFPPREKWESVTMGTHPAGLHGGDFGCSFTQVVAIIDRTAYVVTAMPEEGQVTSAVFDAGLLRRMLGTFAVR